MIIIENNSRGTYLGVCNYLRAKGYTCFKHTAVNDWYAKSDDRALVTWSARNLQAMRRRWRQLRRVFKRVAPSFAIRMARRLAIAGE